MAKDSFILYKEQKEIFKSLSNAQAGKLIKAIFDYVDTGQVEGLDDVLKLAFIPIRQQIDRNEIKWQESKEKRIEAGKLGGIKRAINQGLGLSIKSKQYLDMLSNAKQSQANQAVNVNVNVNDNVYNKKENIKRKSFIAPTLEEINQYILEKKLKVNGKQFYNYFEEGCWKDSKGNQVKNWKQKLLTWNRYADTNTKKQSYEQRDYDNLDFLYKNNVL